MLSNKEKGRYILLDSSFLMECEKARIFELLEDYLYLGELATTKQVISELNLLKKNGNKTARVALMLIEKRGVKILDAPGKNADESLLNLAMETGSVIATNDRKLIKLAKEKGIKVLRLREGKKLMVV